MDSVPKIEPNTHAIRSSVNGSGYGLTKGISLQSAVFTRTFTFFDKNSTGRLDLLSFCAGLAKLSSGEYDTWGEYVFHVMDALHREVVGREEVRAVIGDFLSIFSRLQVIYHTLTPAPFQIMGVLCNCFVTLPGRVSQVNLMHTIRPLLTKAGVDPEAIEAHLAAIDGELQGIDQQV